MVQPYLTAVDTDGETALLLPRRTGRADVQPRDPQGRDAHRPGRRATAELFRAEKITARTPSAAERAVADRVLAALPGGADRLLYARVDLIPGPDGAPVLVELELTEPSLFLGHAPGAADRLADAILTRLR